MSNREANNGTADNVYSTSGIEVDAGAHSGSVSDPSGPIRLVGEDPRDAPRRPCAACATIGTHLGIRHGWGDVPAVWVPLCRTCYQTLVADGPGATPGHGPFGRPYYTRERIAEIVADFARVSAARRANAPTCDLPLDAGGLGPRRVEDPSGAVDAWVEARDAAGAGTPRPPRPIRPVPDPGLAPADDRPGTLIDDAGREAVHEAVGRIGNAVELVQLLAVELVAGGPAGEPRRLMSALGRVHEASIAALTIAALELGVSVPRASSAEVVVCGTCLDLWDPRSEAHWWPEEGRPEPCEACGRLTEYRGLRVRR